MWVHFDGNDYAEAEAGVFTSDTVCGNYAYQGSFQPNGNMSRASTLFKDDDGKAYFISAANNNADLELYQLSDDYLTIAIQGPYSALQNVGDSTASTWQLDRTTGVWSANDGFVPQSGWKLVLADSEETQAEDGHATNAFDGSSSTIWHTQYAGSAPAHPHEIQIDLGASYAIKGTRYLPRQDKDDHGMVADYQFYVSQSLTDWGTPVATGTFDTARTEQRVAFPTTTARYIRFVALSEINGQPWTSVAELDLIPAP
jgi:hypothetical protein